MDRYPADDGVPMTNKLKYYLPAIILGIYLFMFLCIFCILKPWKTSSESGWRETLFLATFIPIYAVAYPVYLLFGFLFDALLKFASFMWARSSFICCYGSYSYFLYNYCKFKKSSGMNQENAFGTQLPCHNAIDARYIDDSGSGLVYDRGDNDDDDNGVTDENNIGLAVMETEGYMYSAAEAPSLSITPAQSRPIGTSSSPSQLP
ncbi:hypothetical protein BDB00DRAFT_931943 [Zychaea mexicana]|uniref:uncharacterized protein n=1 Tax=Zychaea mexicana TaxID=64656 RepID=UPI0022FE356B|nr:uncharacterized protein BDB00DRAFT_931943 [Zychaea mexicana]KAI9489459.1 hypothetical protein BDB00DRAFT_931943 [Zychaea mexicana]